MTKYYEPMGTTLFQTTITNKFEHCWSEHSNKLNKTQISTWEYPLKPYLLGIQDTKQCYKEVPRRAAYLE